MSDDQEHIKPCEQVGWMPHKPHFHKLSPEDKPDEWECPGYEREQK